jgi:hypothetical protein
MEQLCTKLVSTLSTIRAVLRRSTIFIVSNHKSFRAPAERDVHGHDRFTCRSYGAEKLGMSQGYKHIAPPEQGKSHNKRDLLCKAQYGTEVIAD